MTDPTKGNIFTSDVDIKLGDRERAILSAHIQSEGWDVTQALLEDVIRSFNRQLLNVDPADTERVKTYHLMSHVAGRIYVDLMTRLKNEVQLHQYNAARVGTPENPENPNAQDFR